MNARPISDEYIAAPPSLQSRLDAPPPECIMPQQDPRPIRPISRMPYKHADQPHVEPHVAVEDVAELVGDDALQLVAGELLGAAAGDADDRVAGRIAGGEGVDARLVVQQEHGRHRHAGGERHFLDDVQQPALDRVGRVGKHAPAAAGARRRHVPPPRS